ncbi:MAG: hypothetical protein AAFY59_01450 [Pseudomonadota bacterium]
MKRLHTFDLRFGGAATRNQMDVFVNGKPLRDKLGIGSERTISLLAGDHPQFPAAMLFAQLLCEESPTSQTGRVHLYATCEVCADLDCGTIGVRVERMGDAVRWSDFVRMSPCWEDDVDPETYTSAIGRNATFHFNWESYRPALGPESARRKRDAELTEDIRRLSKL